MEGIQIVLSVYLLLRAGGVVLKGKVKDSYTLFYVIIGVLIANYCNIGLISLVLLLCCWIYARRKTAEEMIADFKDDYKILTGSALIDDIDAGDLIVMSREDGSLAVGIVITADKDYISFVSADYLDSLISIHTVTSDFGHIEGYINIKLMDLPDIYSEGILLWPVSGDTGGNITSYFGPRESPGGIGSTNHKGIDIACPVGTEILACADGTVTDAGYHDAMGNYVVIEHDDGMKTVYMHNYKLIVRTGDKVIKGQVISHSGSTGNSTGPHLHIGVMTDGVYVDPLIYMTEPGN